MLNNNFLNLLQCFTLITVQRHTVIFLKQHYKKFTIHTKFLNLNAINAKNFNVLLENYGLNNFQHRLFIRMEHFIHKIVNIEQAPKLLKDQIKMNVKMHKGGYNLRNKISSKSIFKNT